ncbi:class I adenylate-forming enzyme family protein [Actinomycetospora sp. TBRC 11914]|uniref:class I adenylate-forming enzyme family protein n=1 Tax=Actinomycetospora sp. TBRC 11914 TaxID=2729387 RepID=UPI00145CC6AE|nr:class I adenylate-forming enzyme family protein [Actinomycetospora sp. TBRC 11914]NMO92666.1 acyl--CoA ligase [Actinomycetospora sp. TBRC 11914]
MDLATAWSWTVERYPHRRAVGGPAPMTWAQWDARTARLAHALADLGVRRADRVALVLTGGEPAASLHLAVQRLAAVAVPLSTRLGHGELVHCLADAAPTVVVSDDLTAERVAAATADERVRPHTHRHLDDLERLAAAAPDAPPGGAPRPDDVSVMLYTSGTTGRPKGVPRTHAAEHAAAVAHLLQTGGRPGEVTLGVMPLFHTMGLRTLLATVLAAGTWVPQARFDAAEAAELVATDGVTSLYLVPTMFWSLLREDPTLSRFRSVRRLAYAGAAMAPALAERLVEALAPESFVNHFGSTEVYTFSIGPDVAAKPGCAGRAGVFGRLRLVDPTPGASPDALVGPGEQGQVAVSMASPEAFAGYWRRPDATAKAVRDGWYFTGDLAVTDDDGDLWVAGRVDDMINSGGENVYPDEIEAALVRCPELADVVVAGLPDERWGQAVTAFVVPAPGVGADAAVAAADRWGRSALPSLHRPKRVVALSEVPRSAVGKTLRRVLVAGEYTPLADSAVPSPREGNPRSDRAAESSPRAEASETGR